MKPINFWREIAILVALIIVVIIAFSISKKSAPAVGSRVSTPDSKVFPKPMKGPVQQLEQKIFSKPQRCIYWTKGGPKKNCLDEGNKLQAYIWAWS